MHWTLNYNLYALVLALSVISCGPQGKPSHTKSDAILLETEEERLERRRHEFFHPIEEDQTLVFHFDQVVNGSVKTMRPVKMRWKVRIAMKWSESRLYDRSYDLDQDETDTEIKTESLEMDEGFAVGNSLAVSGSELQRLLKDKDPNYYGIYIEVQEKRLWRWTKANPRQPGVERFPDVSSGAEVGFTRLIELAERPMESMPMVFAGSLGHRRAGFHFSATVVDHPDKIALSDD